VLEVVKKARREEPLSPTSYVFSVITSRDNDGLTQTTFISETMLRAALNEFRITRGNEKIQAMMRLCGSPAIEGISKEVFDDIFSLCKIEIAANGHIQT
jgi:hypothetical protein